MTTSNKDKDIYHYTLRVERELAQTFNAIAKENERTGSALLREFMKEYIKKHGQGKLF